MLVFEERGKPEFPEKNLSEQSRELTNSAHIWRRVRESNPGHIGGRRALSPLYQPCSLYPRMLRGRALVVPVLRPCALTSALAQVAYSYGFYDNASFVASKPRMVFGVL